MNAKIVAIAVVAVLVVAGIGVYFATSPGDDEQDTRNYTGRLMVFGNANNDDFIDDRDVAFVKDAIKNDDWDKESNPYADVNGDGRITQADLDLIEKMIKREPMTLRYVNIVGEVKEISYPIGNIVVIGSDAMRAMQILGLSDKVVGRNGSNSPDKYLDPTLNKTIVDNAMELSKSTSKIDTTLLSNLLDKTSVDVVVTGSTAIKDNESAVEGLGPKVIRMQFNDEDVGINSFLTFGYLANAETKAKQVTSFLDDVMKNINDKLATLKDDERVKVVSMAGGGALYANTTTTNYGSWSAKAGAINAITPEMLGGADSKKVAKGDTWNLTSDFNQQYVVYGQGFNYSYAYLYADKYTNDMDYFAEGVWKSYVEQYSWDKMISDNYPQGVVFINWNLYVPLACAYLVSVFYPELFGEDYGDQVHQQFIDLFYPDLKNANYSLDNRAFCVTYDDVKDYLAA